MTASAKAMRRRVAELRAQIAPQVEKAKGACANWSDAPYSPVGRYLGNGRGRRRVRPEKRRKS